MVVPVHAASKLGAPTPLVDDQYMFRRISVVDAASGSVLGMLLPAASGSRRLPEGTNFALASDALLGLLDQSGVELESASAQQSLPPEDLASLAADMTVLVSCWN